MSKYIVFTFLLLAVVNVVVAKITSSEGYYWRDFESTIPLDALPVGFDVNGLPIYVGQVLSQNKLIPGKIYYNGTKIYYELGEHAWSTDENVKILCTPHPEHFEWIPTTTSGIVAMDHTFLVKGGFEPNCAIFIGRTYDDTETNVGKIVYDNNSRTCSALYVSQNNEYRQYQNFEVLIYNPNNVLRKEQ